MMISEQPKISRGARPLGETTSAFMWRPSGKKPLVAKGQAQCAGEDPPNAIHWSPAFMVAEMGISLLREDTKAYPPRHHDYL
jgi:hypothetical protein